MTSDAGVLIVLGIIMLLGIIGFLFVWFTAMPYRQDVEDELETMIPKN